MELETIFPEIFDDASAMARAGVDLDIFDSMRALLGDGIDLEDRAAVEHVIIAPNAYRRIPKTFSRFVDECIRSAKANKAAGGIKRFTLGESGFVLPPISTAPALTLLDLNDDSPRPCDAKDKNLKQISENACAMADSIIGTLIGLNDQLILAEDEEAGRISAEVEEALRAVGVMKLAVDAWHPS